MKTNGIGEKILVAVVLGANIFGIVYFLWRSLESLQISAIFALVILSILVLPYKSKLLRRKKSK